MAITSKSTRVVPVDWHSDTEHRRKIAETINLILDGKLNNIGSISLNSLTTTTTIADARLSINSVIGFDPVDDAAAVEWASGSMVILEASRDNGKHLIKHTSSTATRKFFFTITG